MIQTPVASLYESVGGGTLIRDGSCGCTELQVKATLRVGLCSLFQHVHSSYGDSKTRIKRLVIFYSNHQVEILDSKLRNEDDQTKNQTRELRHLSANTFTSRKLSLRRPPATNTKKQGKREYQLKKTRRTTPPKTI